MQPKVTPFLWFHADAEPAARFYASVFPGSEVLNVTRWGDGGPAPKGSVMSVTFTVAGQRIMALNGGPHFTLNEAFSLFVTAADQKEVDALWAALTADGGSPGQCGWLKDKFGVSWQIIPARMMALMGDADPKKAGRVGQAMMTMTKIDVAALERAHQGK